MERGMEMQRVLNDRWVHKKRHGVQWNIYFFPFWSWELKALLPYHDLPFEELKPENLSEIEITWPSGRRHWPQIHQYSQSWSLQTKFLRTLQHSQWVWARQGVFRQKVMILITKAGIQAEVCSGQKLIPASSHPVGLTAPSGLIGAHGYKVKAFFFGHWWWKHIYNVRGNYDTKIPLSNHVVYISP